MEITNVIQDEGHVIHRYALTSEDLINLAGGIPAANIRELELKVISNAPDAVEIFVNTSLFEVVRVADFASGVISNTHMYVFDQQNHIGTRLFYNQVIAARRHGFQVIYTTLSAYLKEKQLHFEEI